MLEDLWTKIDDRQKTALSLHCAFMQQVAKSSSHGFDLLFGHNLFSIRCLGVSVSYSVSSVSVGLILFPAYVGFLLGIPDRGSAKDLINFATLGCISIAYLFVGTIPVLFPSFRFLKTWLFLILASACVLWVIGFTGFREAMPSPLSAELVNLASFGFPAMVASFGCDVLFIAATRRALRWAGDMTQSYKIVVLVLLNCFFAVWLVLAPFRWATETAIGKALHKMYDPPYTDSGLVPLEPNPPIDLALAVSASNMIDLLAACGFVLLALLLLIHRVFWPLLNRSIFRLQEIGTKGRRSILVSAGLMLFGAAGVGDKVLDWLKKASVIFTG